MGARRTGDITCPLVVMQPRQDEGSCLPFGPNRRRSHALHFQARLERLPAFPACTWQPHFNHNHLIFHPIRSIVHSDDLRQPNELAKDKIAYDREKTSMSFFEPDMIAIKGCSSDTARSNPDL
jgi:hypothetical protein